jgi:hypothetical protein
MFPSVDLFSDLCLSLSLSLPVSVSPCLCLSLCLSPVSVSVSMQFNFTYGEISPLSSGGQSLKHRDHLSTDPKDLPKKSVPLTTDSSTSHYSYRQCRSSKTTSTSIIYSAGATVTPYVIDPSFLSSDSEIEDELNFVLSPHSMICTPKGEAVFAYTNGLFSLHSYLFLRYLLLCLTSLPLEPPSPSLPLRPYLQSSVSRFPSHLRLCLWKSLTLENSFSLIRPTFSSSTISRRGFLLPFFWRH